MALGRKSFRSPIGSV